MRPSSSCLLWPSYHPSSTCHPWPFCRPSLSCHRFILSPPSIFILSSALSSCLAPFLWVTTSTSPSFLIPATVPVTVRVTANERFIPDGPSTRGVGATSGSCLAKHGLPATNRSQSRHRYRGLPSVRYSII